MKRTILGLAATIGCSLASMACTGISLTAKDGSYIQARTIEGAQLELESMYVIIPRGHTIESYTPTGERGLKFKAKYGVVGMSVVLEEFIAEASTKRVCRRACSSSLAMVHICLMTRCIGTRLWATFR